MSVDFDKIVPVGLISTTANTHIPARKPSQIRTYHEQTLKVRSYFQHFFLSAHFLYVCFTDFTSGDQFNTNQKVSGFINHVNFFLLAW